MSQAVDLLDEALELARHEKAALERGSYEEAIELAEKRGEITQMAWNVYDNNDQMPYTERLNKLSKLHRQLARIATSAHNTIRESLKNARLQRKRMQGYHLAVGQAMQ